VAVYFKISTGEQGTVRDFEEPLMTLLSPKAFAPGQPLALTLIADDSQLVLQGKTIGSKREPDDRYVVRVRVVNLRRTDRNLLQTLFQYENEF
jgi:hypothetical protein